MAWDGVGWRGMASLDERKSVNGVPASVLEKMEEKQTTPASD